MTELAIRPEEIRAAIERNVALAESLGINGTPTVILSDGTLIPGAVSGPKLEQMLNQAGKVAAK